LQQVWLETAAAMREYQSPIAIVFIVLCGFLELSHNRFEGVSELFRMLASGPGISNNCA